MRGMRFCLIVLAATLAAPHSAFAQWWNKDWAFRKEIGLDLSAAGANIPGSPTDVPLLVRLHPGNFGYFNDIQADGADLRFVAADDVTPLKYHIERFDAVNQQILAWVRVPRMTGGTSSDFVYLYYGNPSAVAGDDRNGTYDTNQVVVYHFSDANGIASDATAYGNQPAQFAAELTTASLIAGGARFDGTSRIALADAPTTRVLPTQGVTISMWLRMEAPQQDAYLVSAEDAQGRSLVLGINGGAPYARLATGGADAPALLTA